MNRTASDVDFKLLLHAYGTAVDTPDHLRALATGDPAGRAAAIGHLNSAIVHQGTPWTATGPVAEYLCAMVMGDAIGDAATLAQTLLFLGSVAESAALGAGEDLESLATPAGRDIDAEVAAMLAPGDDGESDEDLIYEDNELLNALMARAVLGCRSALPAIAAAALHIRVHSDERVRAGAAETAAMALPAVAPRSASRAGNTGLGAGSPGTVGGGGVPGHGTPAR